MNKITIGKAILNIDPNAKVVIKGSNIDTAEIIWETTEISRADIKAKMNAMAYIPKRQLEYPSIQEQLDMQYWDEINGTTNWKDAISKVKSDNPKE